ncbi:MAG TPA: DUF1801 domain-containing protein [Polyangia bacterium]
MKGQSKATTPKAYIDGLAEPRKTEIRKLHTLIRKTVPQLKPHICADMLAYGPFHYKYASGREGDWFRVGVASNANYISLYSCAADERGYVAERYRKRLPKASIGKSCVRFKKVEHLDLDALKDLLVETAETGFGM